MPELDDAEVSMVASTLESVERAYAVIDNEASNMHLRWMHNRGDLLRPFVTDTNDMRWDFKILQLFSKNWDSKPHLGPLAEFDGRKYPDPDAFPQEAISLARSRAHETSNRILKARYLDFVYEQSSGRDAARAAARAYVDSIGAHLAVSHEQEAVHAFGRALMIVLDLNLADERNELTRLGLQLADELAGSGSHPGVRWALEPLKALLQWRNWRDDGELNRALEITRKGRRFYAAESHLARGFLHIQEAICSRLKDANQAKITRSEIARSHEDEGDGRADSGIVQTVIYRDALEIFRDLGDHESVARLERKISRAVQASAGEMRSVEVSVPIDFSSWDASIAALSNDHGREAVLALSANDGLFPSREQSRDVAREMNAQFPLQGLITNIMVTHDLLVNVVETEEFEDVSTIRQYGLELGLRAVYISRAVEMLRAQNLFDKLVIMKAVEESPFLTSGAPFWNLASDHYFRGDPVSALHLMIPQIEGGVRRIAQAVGQHVTNTKARMEFKTLGTLLSNGVVRQSLGERLAAVLWFCLVEPHGWNLRNDAMHGMATFDAFTKSRADIFLLLALRLSMFRVVALPPNGHRGASAPE